MLHSHIFFSIVVLALFLFFIKDVRKNL